MKYYCQFTRVQDLKWDDRTKELLPCTPHHVDILGSDNVFILDGRNSLYTMIESCIEQANHKPSSGISGFKIVKTDSFRKDGTVVYQHQLFSAWK